MGTDTKIVMWLQSWCLMENINDKCTICDDFGGGGCISVHEVGSKGFSALDRGWLK